MLILNLEASEFRLLFSVTCPVLVKAGRFPVKITIFTVGYSKHSALEERFMQTSTTGWQRVIAELNRMLPARIAVVVDATIFHDPHADQDHPETDESPE